MVVAAVCPLQSSFSYDGGAAGRSNDDAATAHVSEFVSGFVSRWVTLRALAVPCPFLIFRQLSFLLLFFFFFFLSCWRYAQRSDRAEMPQQRKEKNAKHGIAMLVLREEVQALFLSLCTVATP